MMARSCWPGSPPNSPPSPPPWSSGRSRLALPGSSPPNSGRRADRPARPRRAALPPPAHDLDALLADPPLTPLAGAGRQERSPSRSGGRRGGCRAPWRLCLPPRTGRGDPRGTQSRQTSTVRRGVACPRSAARPGARGCGRRAAGPARRPPSDSVVTRTVLRGLAARPGLSGGHDRLRRDARTPGLPGRRDGANAAAGSLRAKNEEVTTRRGRHPPSRPRRSRNPEPEQLPMPPSPRLENNLFSPDWPGAPGICYQHLLLEPGGCAGP